MASRTSSATLAPNTPAPSATTLGDLTTRVDAIRVAAGDLFSAYENDDNVYGLADRADAIRNMAGELTDVLNGVGASLGSFSA